VSANLLRSCEGAANDRLAYTLFNREEQGRPIYQFFYQFG
jgi:hypothetical protein